jgi:hypothetical protein
MTEVVSVVVTEEMVVTAVADKVVATEEPVAVVAEEGNLPKKTNTNFEHLSFEIQTSKPET